MQSLLTSNNTIILRLDPGDDAFSFLTDYCSKQLIGAASFTAIGSAGDVTLAYYNLQTKQFEDHPLQEELEITGITGNIALLDNKHIVHAHGTFSRKDLSVIGGHIKKLIVSATAEVTLTKLEGNLTRKFDEATGLNLLQ